ncbi:MAG: gluconokinase [Chloroflexota bacterium]
MQPTGFVIMGVSGSGKSTLGQALAQRLGWDFFDADDFHPPENIAKMAVGIPLSDSDRTPWLTSLSDLLLFVLKAERHPVLACSALKESYRQQLLAGTNGIEVIYLRGSYELIQERMSGREGHFMKPEMLKSQLSTLEEPKNALILDVSMPLDEMVGLVLGKWFGLGGGFRG